MNTLSLQRAAIVAEAGAESGRPSLVELSLWIRLLFVGAAVTVAGLVSLVTDPAHGAPMLGMTAAGAALAAGAMFRTRRLVRVLSV